MPTITVRVDEDLKEEMDHHPEINWSEVTRQAITEKTTRLERLEQLERLASGSQATEDDVDEIAALVNEKIAQQYDEDEESSE
jgi:altronate dehydratase